MAKTKAANTRIATTVTARYFPTAGATDGFYLDGRMSGRREYRAADITLDREDRGMCMAVFAYPSGNVPDDSTPAQVRKAMDRIVTDLRQQGKSIDTEINELAESAVAVVGRTTLKQESLRQPYFAGIIVRDAEMAAVTMGSGCAYLYRNDVLYPLTEDDFAMEAINHAGKPVTGMDVYSAGVAGTVRYSNIAQLQVDDCLVVCNREVMQALGQREILRMLFEAEDQADAAGLIITAASAKMPGTPMQFMIGFVESIVPLDRTGRFGFTRNQSDVIAAAAALTSNTAPTGSAGAGSSRDRQSAHSSAYMRPGSSQQQTARSDSGFASVGPAGTAATQHASDQTLSSDAPSLPEEPRRHQRMVQPDRRQHWLTGRHSDEREESDTVDYFDYTDEFNPSGQGRKIAFIVIIAAICIGCVFLLIELLGKPGKPAQTTKLTTKQHTLPTTTESSQTTRESTSRTSATTPSQSKTSATTTSAATVITTTSTLSADKVHVVVVGDTLWGIAVKYYNNGSQPYMDLIKQANNMTSDVVRIDQKLIIPPAPEVTTSTTASRITTATTRAN